MSGCKKSLYTPKRILLSLTERGCFNWMPDKLFLYLKYYLCMGKKLDLDHPHTFNEKLQWLKLYDRKARYTHLADKIAVKEYVSSVIGEEYVIPTLAVYNDEDSIEFDSLPEKFVLKCNHDSGSIVICDDKQSFGFAAARKKLHDSLRRSGYQYGREWPYKNIPRRILAETYLETETGDLPDYKIHCFNGIPRLILYCRNRFGEGGVTEDFFDEQWTHLPVKRPTIPNSDQVIPKPEKLEEMLELAKKLSKGIPFLRVDFYYVDNRIYVGELTFFPASGFSRFVPEEWDGIIGDWLQLPDASI